jgi:hypothetical protein
LGGRLLISHVLPIGPLISRATQGRGTLIGLLAATFFYRGLVNAIFTKDASSEI